MQPHRAAVALALLCTAGAVYNEAPCIATGGTCSTQCHSGGTVLTGKCPTQANNVRCCVPYQVLPSLFAACTCYRIRDTVTRGAQESACANVGGKCVFGDTCSGTKHNGMCPRQPAGVKCCTTTSGGGGDSDLALWSPSPNYSSRGGVTPDMIIIHYTAGASAAGSLSWMQNGASGVSAHYLVGKDGTIWQLVTEGDKSWHAGVSSWGARSNLNAYSVGIELDNNGSEAYSAALMSSLVNLIKDIKTRLTVPSGYILGHEDIAPGRKTDPGPLFDWDYLKNHGVPNHHSP